MKVGLEQRLSEALFRRDEQSAIEIKQTLFAIYGFENYLRSVEFFGEQAREGLGEQL